MLGEKAVFRSVGTSFLSYAYPHVLVIVLTNFACTNLISQALASSRTQWWQIRKSSVALSQMITAYGQSSCSMILALRIFSPKHYHLYKSHQLYVFYPIESVELISVHILFSAYY